MQSTMPGHNALVAKNVVPPPRIIPFRLTKKIEIFYVAKCLRIVHSKKFGHNHDEMISHRGAIPSNPGMHFSPVIPLYMRLTSVTRQGHSPLTHVGPPVRYFTKAVTKETNELRSVAAAAASSTLAGTQGLSRRCGFKTRIRLNAYGRFRWGPREEGPTKWSIVIKC